MTASFSYKTAATPTFILAPLKYTRVQFAVSFGDCTGLSLDILNCNLKCWQSYRFPTFTICLVLESHFRNYTCLTCSITISWGETVSYSPVLIVLGAYRWMTGVALSLSNLLSLTFSFALSSLLSHYDCLSCPHVFSTLQSGAVVTRG